MYANTCSAVALPFKGLVVSIFANDLFNIPASVGLFLVSINKACSAVDVSVSLGFG